MDLYAKGAIATATTIGVGNFAYATACAPHLNPPEILFFAGWSLVKGVGYGLTWNWVVPISLARAVVMKPKYIDGGVFGDINVYGLAPHFIPTSSFFPRFHK